MQVLIVGAGHVGQAYGYHLHEGGAGLSYFVRERHISRAERGFDIYPLREGQLPRRLREYELLTSWDEVAVRRFDCVLLAVPSDELRGEWFDQMLESTGDAPIITVRHGIGDRSLLARKLGARVHIRAVTSFFAFDYPIDPGDSEVVGTALWAFPMSQVLIDAPDAESAKPLVALLRAGDLPCRHVRDASVMVGTGEFLLSAVAIMFELCDWSLEEVSGRLEDVRLALAAAHEMSEILETEEELPKPAFRSLLKPRLAVFIFRTFDLGMPFSFAAFVRSHYIKLRSQGERDRRVFVETGRRLGLPTEHIEEVRRRFREDVESRAA